VFTDPTLLRPAPSPRRVSLSLAGVLALALAAVASGLSVASAQAAGTVACLQATLSQPFLKWTDSNAYELVGGGDFEGSSSGWTVSGAAKLAAGSEPYAATGTLGAWSLSLSSGAWAQSPCSCIEPAERTIRFFARSEAGTATVLAQAFFQTSKGLVATTGTKVTLKSTSWEPSPIIAFKPPSTATVTNGTVQAAFRFTSVSGTARIDDVFLDPRMKR
jgi:hypothetical protein